MIYKFIFSYMFSVGLVFMLFAKKPKDFGEFGGKLMSFWCWPALLIIFSIAAYYNRNTLRWQRRNWFAWGLKHFFHYLFRYTSEK